MPRTAQLIIIVMLSMAALVGCSPAPATPAPTASATPVASTPSATATPTAAPATATPTPSPSATASPFPAPKNPKLSGRLPDITTPVPLGEAELGRLTILWESAAGPIGFRIYTKDCDGTVKAALDVPANDRQYGPIHACRPTGNLGVSALYTGGESAISWVR